MVLLLCTPAPRACCCSLAHRAPPARLPARAQACAAGDSSAYARRPATLDDVVIVAALRTPLTKVRAGRARR